MDKRERKGERNFKTERRQGRKLIKKGRKKQRVGKQGRRDGGIEEGEEEGREEGLTPQFWDVAAPLIARKDKVIRPHIKWVNVIDDWCGSSLKV